MLTRLVRSLAPAMVLAALPVASFAGVAIGVSIDIAPPALPVYVQPAPPGEDYIWTPGYWAWGDDDYYWVPGTWVLAPEPGLLWTPGYWGWGGGAYLWHTGYWGRHVGFYGGVNYGCGYGGVGFAGGYWRGGHVVYNRAVTNVTNINVTNVYNRTVVVNNYSHVSFNGGHGGIAAHASAGQLAAEHDRHFDPTPVQRQHIDMAARDRDLRAEVNHGRPHIAATERPASFSGHGVVAARAAGGAFHPIVNHTGEAHPRREAAHGAAEAAHGAGEGAHGGGFAPRNDRPPQAQREAAQRFAASQHNEPPRNEVTHGQPQIHSEPSHGSAAVHNGPARGSAEAMHAPAVHNEPSHVEPPHGAAPHTPAVHNEPPRSPVTHTERGPVTHTEAPQPSAPHSEAHNNFARQAPQPHAGGQPNATPHAQGPRPGPRPGGEGGGGRPEGRGGHGEPNTGQQNRFR